MGGKKATDQCWTLNSQGFIVNKLSGKCIDVDGTPGVGDLTNIHLWSCETDAADNCTDQKWVFNPIRFQLMALLYAHRAILYSPAVVYAALAGSLAAVVLSTALFRHVP